LQLKYIPSVGCDTSGVLVIGDDPTITGEVLVVWCSVVGWCNPVDELTLGSVVVVVVVVVSEGEERASKNSVAKNTVS